jgi:hypothetical protein
MAGAQWLSSVAMNENLRSQGQMMTGIICLSVSVLLFPLALGMLFSYPDDSWYLGIVFTISIGLLTYSGINSIRKSKRMEANNAAAILAMKDHLRTLKTPSTNATESDLITSPEIEKQNNILASWSYDLEYWKKFQKTERKLRLRNELFLLVLITGGGAWMLHDEKAEDWTFSIIFSFGFGCLFLILKAMVSRNNFDVGSSPKVNVVIDSEKLLINDKLYYFNNSDRWLENLTLIEKEGFDLLEFEYGWKTRSGKASDSLFIPVPEGKKGKALALAELIRTQRNFRDPSDSDPRYSWKKKLQS